mmetsp:Transcript_72370/g.212365  ORF Transcript_72370/g.212365 Transcript_72370/m.212365 type:complete len:115 (+) Transcript_72370:49-393(+)
MNESNATWTQAPGKDPDQAKLSVYLAGAFLVIVLCVLFGCCWLCCWCCLCGTRPQLRGAMEATVLALEKGGHLPKFNDRAPEPGMRVLPGEQVGVEVFSEKELRAAIGATGARA